MSVTKDELVDLIAGTLQDLPKQYFEVTWDNPDYEFCRIYQSERMQVDGGKFIDRKVMFDPTGNARYRRYYDTDTPTVGDVLKTITVPWTQIGTHYSWDKLEILHNKNSAKGFINLMEVRRVDGLWSLAKLIEDRAWKTPTSSSDDLYPYGVPYYLNMLDNALSDGFNAVTVRYQDGTTGTSCAGIDAAVETKWKNYAAIYTSVNNALLKKFRTAFIRTRFKAPLFINDPAQKRTAAKRIYCNADTAVELMDIVDQRDDDHRGNDAMGNIKVDDGGVIRINRLPVVYIAELDGVTDPVDGIETDPIYCVDFEKFIPVVHEGYWMEESEPETDRGQHTTFTVFLDGAHNNLCTNRRTAGFVIHKQLTT